MLQKKCKYQDKGGLGTFEIQSCLHLRCQNSSPCRGASRGTGPRIMQGQEGARPSLPWQACPLGAALHSIPPPPATARPAHPVSELLQKDATARRLWKARILATSEAGILRARPNSRLFSSPSLPLMCVPHGLEGQVRGKRREVDRKCSIQPHPSLDEASQATGPGWGVAGGREENKRSPLAEYCHLSVTKVNLQPFRTQ